MTHLRDKVPEDLGKVELGFVKRFRKKMDEDAARLARQNFKNSRTALLITAGVAGIYFYSMYAVKQENILEELDNAVQQK